jgi:hypothetical protein
MWKRTSTWVAILTILAAVATGALPYFPRVVDMLRLSDAEQLQRVIFSVIAIHVALLTGNLSLRLIELRQDFQAAISRIETAVQGPTVRRLRDHDFYNEFLQAAKGAKTSVCICYFAPHPPSAVPDRERQAYYRAMRALMTKRGDQIRFRRLVRRSPDNERWAADEVRRLIGKPRLHFALIDDLDAQHEMPLALSVQIVDDERAWLVAVQSHEQIGPYRDLAIEGSDLPKMLQLYFERLWRHADVILDNGILTPSGHALFQRLGIEA